MGQMRPEPAKDIVVVKPMKLSDLQQGVFVAVSEKQPEMGEVVSVGVLGKDTEAPFGTEIKVGDKVLYRKYGSSNFIIGGSEYAFVGIADLVGRIGEI